MAKTASTPEQRALKALERQYAALSLRKLHLEQRAEDVQGEILDVGQLIRDVSSDIYFATRRD